MASPVFLISQHPDSSSLLQTINQKKHNLKAENSALFSEIAEDLGLGRILSYSSEGWLWRGKPGARMQSSLCSKTR